MEDPGRGVTAPMPLASSSPSLPSHQWLPLLDAGSVQRNKGPCSSRAYWKESRQASLWTRTKAASLPSYLHQELHRSEQNVKFPNETHTPLLKSTLSFLPKMAKCLWVKKGSWWQRGWMSAWLLKIIKFGNNTQQCPVAVRGENTGIISFGEQDTEAHIPARCP